MNNTWRQQIDAHKHDFTIGLIILILGFVIFFWSPVYLLSDSQYALVVSESLIRHHSFAVDHFALPRLEPKDNGFYVRDGNIYQLEWAGDHLYYFLPPGGSVLSVPFVGLMDLFGLSAINQDGTYNLANEIKQQTILAALLMALLAVIFYFTGRLVLPKTWSVVVAVGGTAGTQVWSTLSRGLWSDTWGVFLLALIILILFAAALNKARLRPVLLGSLLSWTYFVRPTNAIPILAVTAYVFIYYRRALFRLAATGLIWLGSFVFYSWFHFHKILPSYYKASRLTFDDFGEALAGNLISPSRGLFVYVPVLLFILYLLVRYRKKITLRELVALALSIVAIHWVVISGFPEWWGGGSYGPRLMSGLVPWFVCLAIIAIKAMLDARAENLGKLRFWKTQTVVGGLLLVMSLAMNGIGAIMGETVMWNERPVRVSRLTSRLWDWRYPQFLAGFVRPPLPEVFPPGDTRVEFSRHASQPYLWYGWSINEETRRWTEANEAGLIFSLEEITDSQLRMKFQPFIVAGMLDQQRVNLRLNGRLLETLNLKDPAPQEFSRPLPKEILQPNNILIFELPDARSPKSLRLSEDTRALGLALFWLEIEPTKSGGPIQENKQTVAQAPLIDGGYDAEIQIIEAPAQLKAGETANLKVSVKNVSSATWPSNGRLNGQYKINLGNHWLDRSGGTITLNGARIGLPYDLKPGRIVELVLSVRAPETPGQYILELDMVQEQVTWFADEGSRTARMELSVYK